MNLNGGGGGGGGGLVIEINLHVIALFFGG